MESVERLWPRRLVETRPTKFAVETRLSKLAVDTRPSKFALETRPIKLAVETWLSKFAVDTRFVRLAVDTRPSKLLAKIDEVIRTFVFTWMVEREVVTTSPMAMYPSPEPTVREFTVIDEITALHDTIVEALRDDVKKFCE